MRYIADVSGPNRRPYELLRSSSLAPWATLDDPLRSFASLNCAARSSRSDGPRSTSPRPASSPGRGRPSTEPRLA